MQRQEIAEDDDLAVLGPLRQRGGDQVGRRHQAVDVLMVLVEHHAVEAELVGIGELVDILLIEAAAFLRVPQLFGTVTQPVSYFSSKSAGRCG